MGTHKGFAISTITAAALLRIALCTPSMSYAQSRQSAQRVFVQVPGPNPILRRGQSGAWDDTAVEAADIAKSGNKYYLFYHGYGHNSPHFQVGVATSAKPFGPWARSGGEPALRPGPAGAWDGKDVACASILQADNGIYLMFYCGYSDTGSSKWGIGLATAPSLDGPWMKYAGNPLLGDFGYVGGVVKHAGRYYMYAEYPIGATAPDYGPIAVAVADRPEGPWNIQPEPALPAPKPGEWDDGGYSEGKVVYDGGLFHLFYGGAKPNPTRILSRENIGYATSLDGLHFVKNKRNPVASWTAEPNAGSFSEVHALLEPPYVYLFHTLRYLDPALTGDLDPSIYLEELGVQALLQQTPIEVSIPVLAG